MPSKKDGPPEWFLVLPAGRLVFDGRQAIFDQAAARSVLKDFNARGADMVIDYEHQTLGQGKAPAAGWVTALEMRGDGLWARARWNRRAARFIASGEYRYFSPVITIDEHGRVETLINLGLTNQPRLRNITALAAKEIPGQAHWPTPEKQRSESMLEKLIRFLGLEPAAGEEEVVEAVAALVQPPAQNEEGGGEGGEPAPGPDPDPLAAEVAALRAELGELQRERLVEAALGEGRLSPGELEDWAGELARENPVRFKQVVAGRPAGSAVPLGPLGAPAARGAHPSRAQRAVNRLVGLSQEDYINHSGRI